MESCAAANFHHSSDTTGKAIRLYRKALALMLRLQHKLFLQIPERSVSCSSIQLFGLFLARINNRRSLLNWTNCSPLLGQDFVRRFCLAILLVTLVAVPLRWTAAQDMMTELKAVSAEGALELLEIRDRWRELLTVDREQPTPFSQTGITVLAEGFTKIYAQPVLVRDQLLSDLQAGVLVRLLPPELLKSYCKETDRVTAEVNDNGASPIKAELPAEIVHAAPALSALSSELPALIERLGKGADQKFDTVLPEVREALLASLELRRARAAIELTTASADGGAPASAAIELLRRTLEKRVPLAELARRLPTALLGDVALCRADGVAWPALAVIDKATRDQWADLKAAFEAFFGAADGVLLAIEERANAAIPGLPPLKQLIEPALDAPRTAEQLAKKWRIVFEFTPRTEEPRIGTIELVAVNEVMRLTVPLGISIANVERAEAGSGQVTLKFLGDDFLQSVHADSVELQAALAEIGLSDWARIRSPRVTFDDTLRTVVVDLGLELPAVGVELPFRLTLHDAAKPVDLQAEIERIARELAAALANKLLEKRPRVVTAWGNVELQVGTVAAGRTLKGGPWQLSISGELRSPLDEAMVGVVLELGADGGAPFRLRSAAISPELQARVIDGVNAAFDKAIAATANLAAIPPEANKYLRRCIALEGVEVGPGPGGEPVALHVKVSAGGASHSIELMQSSIDSFADALLNVVKDRVVTCALSEWTAFQARAALKLTEDEINTYVAKLQTLKIEVLGTIFSVDDVQRPSGSRGFLFDLVGKTAKGAEVRFGELELKLDLWKPDQPLVLVALDFSGARISPADARALLIAAVDLPDALLQQVDISLNGGKFRVTPHLTIDALGGQITVPPIELTPAMSMVDVQNAFLTAANSVIGQLVKQRVGNVLPDLGVVQSVTVDAANSRFLPVGGKSAAISLLVITDLTYAKVRWTITIEIDRNGHSTISVDAGNLEGQLILGDYLVKALQGIAPGTPENIEILTSAPYGILFDVKADVGGFKVILKGVRITTNGIKLSSKLKLEYRQPPGIQIPPAFQALPVELTIDLDNLADFEIGAFITIVGDDYGVIGVDARLRGKGSEKRLETEGVVKILKTLALVKSTGAVDFSKGTITMRTAAVGELSRLLDIGDQITITTNPMEAEIAAGIDVLGIGANGHLNVAVEGKNAKIALGGRAKLLLGDANVDVVLDSRLRGSGASGSVETFIGTASLAVTPSTAQVKLDVHGLRIKLIAPSVKQLTEDLLKEALRRLFDFKISLDGLKNREIVISLLDSTGRPNTDPLGGDPIGGKAPDSADPTPDPGKGEGPPPVEDPGKGGDAQSFGESLPGCGLPDSKMIGSASKFPNHVVEMTDGPDLYFYWHESRAAPKSVWDAIKGQPQIACFQFYKLDYPRFEPEGYVVASPHVQVLIKNDGQPTVMVWRKDQKPIDLQVSEEALNILLDGAPGDNLLEAAKSGFEVTGFARRLLRLLVAKTINAAVKEKIVDVAKVSTEFLPSVAIDGTHPGAIAMIQKDDKAFLRVLLSAGNDDTPDPEISSGEALFMRLDEIQERKGPLGQLVVAGFAAGNRLRVVAEDADCVLLVADGVNMGEQWRDRLFAVTPIALAAVQLINASRTVDSIRGAEAGPLVCREMFGANGASRWQALSAGKISDDEAAFAFAGLIGTPGWNVRLAFRAIPGSGAKADPIEPRDRLGTEIEDKLRLWAKQGSVKDPVLANPPLDAEGQMHLLDTMVLPEILYLNRLQINPRGLP